MATMEKFFLPDSRFEPMLVRILTGERRRNILKGKTDLQRITTWRESGV